MSRLSSWIRRTLPNLLLAAAALAVAFGAGEVVVRALYKDSNVLFPRYHTDYRYGKYTLRGIRPGSHFVHSSVDGQWKFDTNGRGFRDTREFAYEKPPQTVRILSLGDSHTQGYEVRQQATFTAAAERYLAEHRVRAEAINAGVSGYSTAEELAFLENEGYKYQPDVVVVGFYANDFEDNLKAGLFELDAQGRLAEKKFEHIPGVRIQNAIYALAPVRWLSENSHFYSLLFNSVWEHFKALAARSAKAQAATEYAVPMESAVGERELALAAALIERMQRFCAERRIRLIVADIPQRRAPYRFDSSMPAELVSRLKASGVEILPSESLLTAYQGTAEMHVPNGHQHISEFTHTLIGAEVGRRVLQENPLMVKR